MPRMWCLNFAADRIENVVVADGLIFPDHQACVSVFTCRISAAGNEVVVAKGEEEVGV
jgi:hypothetical protein